MSSRGMKISLKLLLSKGWWIMLFGLLPMYLLLTMTRWKSLLPRLPGLELFLAAATVKLDYPGSGAMLICCMVGVGCTMSICGSSLRGLCVRLFPASISRSTLFELSCWNWSIICYLSSALWPTARSIGPLKMTSLFCGSLSLGLYWSSFMVLYVELW